MDDLTRWPYDFGLVFLPFQKVKKGRGDGEKRPIEQYSLEVIIRDIYVNMLIQ